MTNKEPPVTYKEFLLLTTKDKEPSGKVGRGSKKTFHRTDPSGQYYVRTYLTSLVVRGI